MRPTAIDIRTRPLAVARAVSALLGSGPLGRRKLEAVAQIIAYTAVGIEDLSELDGPTRWVVKQATMELLRRAPDLGLDLRVWIRETARGLGEIVGELVDEPKHKAARSSPHRTIRTATSRRR